MAEYDKDTAGLQASRLIHTKTYTANAVQRVSLSCELWHGSRAVAWLTVEVRRDSCYTNIMWNSRFS